MTSNFARFVVVAASVAVAASANAQAGNWGNLAVISDTLGNHAGRLCVGEGLRASDIGCPMYAPSVTTAGDVSVTGNLSASKFIGDGSLLTGVGPSDRITSGTTNVIANQDRSLTFTTGGTQRMIIGENGHVGIGTSTPQNALEASGGTARESGISQIRISDNVSAPIHYFLKQRATGLGQTLNGDQLGAIIMRGTDETGAPTENIMIRGSADGATSTDSHGGYLSFHTKAVSSTTLLERVRLSADGTVGIGTAHRYGQVNVRRGGAFDLTNAQTAASTSIVNMITRDADLAVGQAFAGLGWSAAISNGGTLGAAIAPVLANGDRPDLAMFVIEPTGLNLREIMRIRNIGTVGIGTSSPTATLQVSGTFIVSNSAQTTTPSLYVGTDGNVGIGVTQPTTTLYVGGIVGASEFSVPRHDGRIGHTIISNRPWSSSGVPGTDTRDLIFSFAGGGTLGETVRFMSNGRVGISRTAPLAKLDVNGTISASDAIQVGTSSLACSSGIPGAMRYASGNMQFCNGTSWTTLGSAGAATAASSTGAIQFNAANALAGDTANLFWDDNNDRLGIGTATPEQRVHLVGESYTDASIKIEANRDHAGSGGLDFYRSRGTASAKTALNTNDILGGINFYSHDGDSYEFSAQIAARVEGTVSDGLGPSRLVFGTREDGDVTVRERMTVLKGGNVGIGTPASSPPVFVTASSTPTSTTTPTHGRSRNAFSWPSPRPRIRRLRAASTPRRPILAVDQIDVARAFHTMGVLSRDELREAIDGAKRERQQQRRSTLHHALHATTMLTTPPPRPDRQPPRPHASSRSKVPRGR